MNRRSLLTALGSVAAGAVAGCVGSGTNPASVTRSETRGSEFPSLSARADSLPAPGLSASVSVVEDVDREEPARVRIELANEGSSERREWFGVTPPFTELWGERVDGGAVAVLVPVDRPRLAEVIPETPTRGTWRATDDFGVNATARRVSIAPNETLGRTYAFLAGVHSDGLPAGEYRFEAEDYLGDEPWGFTVVVSY